MIYAISRDIVLRYNGIRLYSVHIYDHDEERKITMGKIIHYDKDSEKRLKIKIKNLYFLTSRISAIA